VVTLNGSFEDANAGDSHSFLWHLENSTNAQTVPDSSTQSLSFTPTDNGVYTFRFTVTDNYGAQGSDTVVVTAWNLPPVTVIDHLTDETGGEIGVYAPDALFGPDVILKASFRDAGTADIHAAQVDWGDGSVDTMFATFTDSTGGAAGSLGAAHDYAAPGIYTITLDVSDDDSGTGRATRQVGVARCRRSCRRP
jgi:PKD repeat protein